MMYLDAIPVTSNSGRLRCRRSTKRNHKHWAVWFWAQIAALVRFHGSLRSRLCNGRVVERLNPHQPPRSEDDGRLALELRDEVGRFSCMSDTWRLRWDLVGIGNWA